MRRVRYTRAERSKHVCKRHVNVIERARLTRLQANSCLAPGSGNHQYIALIPEAVGDGGDERPKRRIHTSIPEVGAVVRGHQAAVDRDGYVSRRWE